MRVLVTGAAGFLGQHFTRYFIEQGDEVIAVDNLSASSRPDFPLLKVEAGEFFSASNVDFDLAVHLAAPVGGRTKIEGDPLFNADSLRLDAAFFSWAIKHTKKAIYPSSSAVYGVSFQVGEGRALSESMFEPERYVWPKPDQIYGFTKMAGEVLAHAAANYGLTTLCIRPFSGYGEGQSLDYPVPAICQRALNKENPLVIWGSGHQTRDFVHVSDVIAATVERIDNVQHYSTLNIGTGHATSFVQIAEIAADIVGYHPKITTDKTKPEGVHARFADTTLLKTFYQPKVGLREGLSRVLEALSANSSKT